MNAAHRRLARAAAGRAPHRLRQAAARRLGLGGGLGLALLLLALGLAAGLRPAWRAEQADLLRRHVAGLEAASRVADAASAVAARRDPRDLAREALPAWDAHLATDLRLLAWAERAGLGIEQGEYAVEAAAPALVRQRVTLPFRGPYGGLRAFVATVLDGAPHAALDAIELEQGEDGLGGRLRLSFWYRESGS